MPQQMRHMYNTPLSPENEQRFSNWVSQTQSKYGVDLRPDLDTYDLRGYWLNGGHGDEAFRSRKGHAPDTYKKPSHPTFSDESIYHGKPDANGVPQYGGTWRKTADGTDYLAPHNPNANQIVGPALRIGGNALLAQAGGFSAALTGSLEKVGLSIPGSSKVASDFAQRATKRASAIPTNTVDSWGDAKSVDDKLNYLGSKATTYAVKNSPQLLATVAVPGTGLARFMVGTARAAPATIAQAIGDTANEKGGALSFGDYGRATISGIKDAAFGPAEDAVQALGESISSKAAARAKLPL